MSPFMIHRAELWELLTNLRWTETSQGCLLVVSLVSHMQIKEEITECNEFQMEESL